MTVKDLIKELKLLDENRVVIITDDIGWSNIKKIESKGLNEVKIVMESEAVFQES